MRVNVLFIIIASSIGLTSCFEKDEAMVPGAWDGSAFAFDESIYFSQFYYSLSSNVVISKNNNEAWDLAFESAKTGWHIRINSSNLLATWRTGSTNFDLSSFPLTGGTWMYDKSDGDQDSTAVDKWVDTSTNVYTNQVYLLGKYDGIDYRPFKKVVFTQVTDTSYCMKYADLNGTNLHEVIVKKDTAYNNVCFSFATHSTVAIEPLKDKWDLQFTQYTTTLYTDDDIAVPYFVRGVLVNPYKVEAVLDSVHEFLSISLTTAGSLQFSQKQDVIGHDWKSVDIDEQANSAKYKVREKYTFLIHDAKGDFYKLKFTSFFNSARTPGYPAFIFLKL